jgi:site-specific recombinase XerD
MNIFNRSVSLVDQQVSVWIAWENRVNPYGLYLREYERWVREFIRFISKADLCDVDESDVDAFLDQVALSHNGQYPVRSAEKAVNSVRRFYTARGKKMSRSSCYNV